MTGIEVEIERKIDDQLVLVRYLRENPNMEPRHRRQVVTTLLKLGEMVDQMEDDRFVARSRAWSSFTPQEWRREFARWRRKSPSRLQELRRELERLELGGAA